MTGKDRRYLRALAHALSPVVIIGKRGLSDAIVRQVDQALSDHELIKARLAPDCPVDRAEAAEALSAGTRCEVVGAIGRVLILYRRHPEHPRIRLPGAAEAASDEEPGC